ncbi:response regulator [Rhodobacter sphaeroides]|jgi:two-component system torCAD operon response regulator TorR|uniref:Regulatory protein VirG n=2 Tax=Cereibacter sphaeroides TaxID=1063 RepID=Q3IXS3_CERS4|nr:response regulator [Cereibacter sphaeroides]ABN78852.1 two component transcriptional regulator, winged helix family [Cereibacter sphaeroides ATCC 17029]ABA80661.1 DMSO/TMAO-two component transcriptional regulator, winged helix family [Cereibacter sphaeroides 2.4.1]AMJ48988.1 two-component system response regulator [Cereibacter sphaeroides]ANS35704.1 DNA-binding response regulator [Cereibacter sphaeroides]ATN64757.1 DNA-binding response regulator [Cereibacter sphaeroides]
MKKNYHMLVVEDDPVSRQTLAMYLRKENHEVSEARDGEQMRRVFAKGDVDVVMLDINMPGEDGLSILRELRRQSEVGIIMVTSRKEDVDRIVALELGADDYVTKPYNMREILPRAKNLARRVAALRLVRPDQPATTFDGWTLDAAHWALTDPAGNHVKLTRAEFELLATFVAHPGQVLTRDQLMNHVGRRGHETFDRTIDVLVRRIRRKIEADPSDPRLIVTVHGIGYVFQA